MAECGHTIIAVVPSDSTLHKKLSRHADTVTLVLMRRLFRKFRWWVYFNFQRTLNDLDPDIVVLHDELPSLLNLKLKYPGNRRFSLVALVPHPLHDKTSRIVDVIIPHTKTQANAEYHIDMVNPIFSSVVPVFSRFTPVERINRKSKIENLVAVGRITVEKGFKFLIEAMHELTCKGYDLKLSIVGTGPEKENLIRQRDALNLEDVIHFEGESHQVQSLMREADLFVLSSVFEPFGIVLLEAMASGLPIVATKTDGPKEVFDECSAVLVEAESVSALSEGIQFAIQDLNATYQRACVALDLYKSHYSTDVVVPKFIEVFQHCIDIKNEANRRHLS